eukprot:8123668-Ditylum_brightwellii.AAC.1
MAVRYLALKALTICWIRVRLTFVTSLNNQGFSWCWSRVCTIWNCMAPAGNVSKPEFSGQIYAVVPGILA